MARRGKACGKSTCSVCAKQIKYKRITSQYGANCHRIPVPCCSGADPSQLEKVTVSFTKDGELLGTLELLPGDPRLIHESGLFVDLTDDDVAEWVVHHEVEVTIVAEFGNIVCNCTSACLLCFTFLPVHHVNPTAAYVTIADPCLPTDGATNIDISAGDTDGGVACGVLVTRQITNVSGGTVTLNDDLTIDAQPDGSAENVTFSYVNVYTRCRSNMADVVLVCCDDKPVDGGDGCECGSGCGMPGCVTCGDKRGIRVYG